MIIDRIREEMSVIAADDRCVGFVCAIEGDGMLRITSISAGFGFDHLIPLSWVSDVDKYVYLDKTSAFAAANWESAPEIAPLPAAAGRFTESPDRIGILQPKAA